MKLNNKELSLKEDFDKFNNEISIQDNSIVEVEDKAIDAMNPVMADAMKNFKKTSAIRNAKIDTDLENVRKVEGPIIGMKVKMAPGAKKLHLDESLFREFYDEDEKTDAVIIVFNDETEDYFYTDEYQADAHYAELNSMSDEELANKGIKLIARVWKTDDETFGVTEKRSINGDENGWAELAQYIDNLNGLSL